LSKPVSPSDETLLRMWRAGHLSAGDRLCRRYIVGVRRYFERKADNEEDAKDLTAQTFAALHEKIQDIRDPDKIRRYLFSIAENQERKYRAKMGRRRCLVEQLRWIPESRAAGASTMIDGRREWRLIRRGIRALPVELRSVTILAYEKGLTSSAIGERLGLPAPTVRTRLYRARKALRCFVEMHPEEGLRDSTLTNFGG